MPDETINQKFGFEVDDSALVASITNVKNLLGEIKSMTVTPRGLRDLERQLGAATAQGEALFGQLDRVKSLASSLPDSFRTAFDTSQMSAMSSTLVDLVGIVNSAKSAVDAMGSSPGAAALMGTIEELTKKANDLGAALSGSISDLDDSALKDLVSRISGAFTGPEMRRAFERMMREGGRAAERSRFDVGVGWDRSYWESSVSRAERDLKKREYRAKVEPFVGPGLARVEGSIKAITDNLNARRRSGLVTPEEEERTAKVLTHLEEWRNRIKAVRSDVEGLVKFLPFEPGKDEWDAIKGSAKKISDDLKEIVPSAEDMRDAVAGGYFDIRAFSDVLENIPGMTDEFVESLEKADGKLTEMTDKLRRESYLLIDTREAERQVEGLYAKMRRYAERGTLLDVSTLEDYDKLIEKMRKEEEKYRKETDKLRKDFLDEEKSIREDTSKTEEEKNEEIAKKRGNYERNLANARNQSMMNRLKMEQDADQLLKDGEKRSKSVARGWASWAKNLAASMGIIEKTEVPEPVPPTLARDTARQMGASLESAVGFSEQMGFNLGSIGGLVGTIGKGIAGWGMGVLGPLALLVAVAKVLMDAEKQGKAANKAIADMGGAANLTMGSFSGLTSIGRSLENIRQQVYDIGAAWEFRVTPDEQMKVLAALEKAHYTLREIDSQYEKVTEATAIAWTYSKMLGREAGEVASVMGDWHEEMFMNQKELQATFADIYRDAKVTGMNVGQFFDVVQRTSTAFAIWGGRISEVSDMLRLMQTTGTLGAKEASKAVEDLVGHYTKMTDEQRITIGVMAGTTEVQKAAAEQIESSLKGVNAELSALGVGTLDASQGMDGLIGAVDALDPKVFAALSDSAKRELFRVREEAEGVAEFMRTGDPLGLSQAIGQLDLGRAMDLEFTAVAKMIGIDKLNRIGIDKLDFSNMNRLTPVMEKMMMESMGYSREQIERLKRVSFGMDAMGMDMATFKELSHQDQEALLKEAERDRTAAAAMAKKTEPITKGVEAAVGWVLNEIFGGTQAIAELIGIGLSPEERAAAEARAMHDTFKTIGGRQSKQLDEQRKEMQAARDAQVKARDMQRQKLDELVQKQRDAQARFDEATGQERETARAQLDAANKAVEEQTTLLSKTEDSITKSDIQIAGVGKMQRQLGSTGKYLESLVVKADKEEDISAEEVAKGAFMVEAIEGSLEAQNEILERIPDSSVYAARTIGVSQDKMRQTFEKGAEESEKPLEVAKAALEKKRGEGGWLRRTTDALPFVGLAKYIKKRAMGEEITTRDEAAIFGIGGMLAEGAAAISAERDIEAQAPEAGMIAAHKYEKQLAGTTEALEEELEKIEESEVEAARARAKLSQEAMAKGAEEGSKQLQESVEEGVSEALEDGVQVDGRVPAYGHSPIEVEFMDKATVEGEPEVTGLFEKLTPLMESGVFGPLGKALTKLQDDTGDVVPSLSGLADSLDPGVFSGLSEEAKRELFKVREAAEALSDLPVSPLAAMIDEDALKGKITDVLGSGFEMAKGVASDVWDATKGLGAEAFDLSKALASSTWEATKALPGATADMWKGAAGATWTGITEKDLSEFKELPGVVAGAYGQLYGVAKEEFGRVREESKSFGALDGIVSSSQDGLLAIAEEERRLMVEALSGMELPATPDLGDQIRAEFAAGGRILGEELDFGSIQDMTAMQERIMMEGLGYSRDQMEELKATSAALQAQGVTLDTLKYLPDTAVKMMTTPMDDLFSAMDSGMGTLAAAPPFPPAAMMPLPTGPLAVGAEMPMGAGAGAGAGRVNNVTININGGDLDKVERTVRRVLYEEKASIQ